MRALMLTCLLLVLLQGCASPCPDCLSLTKEQLGKALGTAWRLGFEKGFDAGEDAADVRRVAPI